MSQMNPVPVELEGVPHTRTQSTSIVAGKKELASGAPAQLPPTATFLRTGHQGVAAESGRGATINRLQICGWCCTACLQSAAAYAADTFPALTL